MVCLTYHQWRRKLGHLQARVQQGAKWASIWVFCLHLLCFLLNIFSSKYSIYLWLRLVCMVTLIFNIIYVASVLYHGHGKVDDPFYFSTMSFSSLSHCLCKLLVRPSFLAQLSVELHDIFRPNQIKLIFQFIFGPLIGVIAPRKRSFFQTGVS